MNSLMIFRKKSSCLLTKKKSHSETQLSYYSKEELKLGTTISSWITLTYRFRLFQNQAQRLKWRKTQFKILGILGILGLLKNKQTKSSTSVAAIQIFSSRTSSPYDPTTTNSTIRYLQQVLAMIRMESYFLCKSLRVKKQKTLKIIAYFENKNRANNSLEISKRSTSPSETTSALISTANQALQASTLDSRSNTYI